MKSKIITLLAFTALSIGITRANTPFLPEQESTTGEIVKKTGDVNYSSQAGNFKFTFPGKPTTNSQTVDLGKKLGNTTIYTFMYETENSVVMVSYSDYPKEAMNNVSSLDDVLNNAMGGFIENLNLTVETKNGFDFGTYRGLFFKAKSDQYSVIAKNYLVGNRLYQTAIMYAGGYASDAEVTTYLESFKLLN